MMNRASLTRMGLGILSLAILTTGTPTHGQAAEKTGSIKGTISVRRVKSPENVVVYVVKAVGTYPAPKKPAEMDQKKLAFIPHVLPIVKGTTVRFLNSDPILHNIFWPKSKDGSYSGRNLGTWGKGGSRTFKFEQEGHVVLLCNVHPEMESHILVLQNPFFAVVGKDGNYEIKNVPPGNYTVKAWYPRPKKLRAKTADVTVSADKVTEQDFALGR